ncbi:DUF1642 domain-containing protein [Listeria monocytogenes]|nr:DUF1642 domain-containing protein [Listeria monocytogenes]EAC9495891.1 DUF1642 domain-containing protein [Listeria monocytogenes]EAC9498791.1 DUF1642 domain-containing protein [Listeria monocytogenes]EAF2171062.1 DUF1642 domain-containing protein [Listeria monocytogenes]EAF5964925.1 DUF1642 domain-containing protein [Listeria monocytogenes]
MKFKKGDRVEVIWRSELHQGLVEEVIELTDELMVKLAKTPAIYYLFKKNQVSKVELVKVPKFVADAIGTFKEKEYDLAVAIDYETYTDECVKELSLDKTMCGWLWETSNQELFARAWMDGYVVEEEPLYYVQLIDHATGYLNVHYDNQKLVGSNDEASEYKTQFTESEIKAMNKGEAYWLLKEPVEEVEGEA